MLRIVACICIVILLSSCEKNWRRLHVEKRIYRNGYYVHLPWERRTPVNAYPKPAPFPVQYTRVTGSDSAQTKSRVTVTTGDSTFTRTSGSGGSNPVSSFPTGNNSGGISAGINPPAPNGPGIPVITPTATATGYFPSPPLQPLPPVEAPPLPPPPTDSVVVVTDPQPDSLIAVVDSLPSLPTDTIVRSKSFDFPEGEFSLIAEAGFYNPVYTSGAAIKPLSYNAGAALRYTIHPWSRHKISAECGLFISNLFISQDQHKSEPLFMEACDKERIMQWKSRFMLMDQVYFTRKEDAKFDAVQLGIFSDVGLFSTHVAVSYHGNDAKAALTRSKTRLFGLNYLRPMQYGLTARVANDVWSVFANYRFSTMLKANPDGVDLPKLVLGATFAFGE